MNARSLFHDLYARLATFLENGESRTIAYLLLDQICNITKEDVIACKGVKFASKVFSKLDGYVSRLQNHEPIQYILGTAVFYGRDFKVDQNVLIPRPETEELVQWCIGENNTPNPDILDIGTGSGCIAITLKKEIPKSNVYALDFSPKALITASENAMDHKCEIKFYETDILKDNLNAIELDIIISNPPYVRKSESALMADRVTKFEPPEALPVTSFCAQVAEVGVDPETGRVRIHRLVTIHDVGTILNPITHQGQIDGGVIQGMGLGLLEETPMVDGHIAALHMGDFKIPTFGDVPSLQTVLLEEQAGPAPYQGKAIGEIPNVPTAAAIANAVHDAIGVRLFDLPITAEKVFSALRSA